MITIEMTTSRGDFILSDNNEPVMNLKRTDWWSSTAETTYLGNTFRIKSVNFFESEFNIFENDNKVGKIKFSWTGDVYIDLSGQNYKKHVFQLKRKGVFQSRFELYNSKHKHILTLYPKFDWSNFCSNYTIEEKNMVADDVDIYELIMYCVYSASTCQKKQLNG